MGGVSSLSRSVLGRRAKYWWVCGFCWGVPVRCPLAGKQNARQDHGICRYERWRPFENDGTWESVRVDTNGWRVDFARRNAKFWTN
jgi:hypothetical protein